MAHSGRKLYYLLFLFLLQSLETNGLAFTYASVVYMFMHAHVSVNLFCTQDRYKLMKSSIFSTHNHMISWAGHNEWLG